MSAVRNRIAVIGAGVAGLTAAYRLRQQCGADVRIDVYDQADRPGGLLRTRTVGSVPMDVGAEAFIVRRPEALDLVTELGLEDSVVAPGPLRPAIWAGGTLHSLPTPALMGIPRGPGPVTGLADADDLARMAAEPDVPFRWRPGDDPSVGAMVGERFGPSVVARGVDPMLGGVYSSVADQVGLRETIPALAAALDAGAPSLTSAVEHVLDAGAGGGGPVFGALRGGYRELVDALVDSLESGGTRLLLGRRVTRVIRRPGGRYSLAVEASGAPQTVDYDAAIVAVPPWTAGRLLAEAAPEAAELLAAVQPAGSAVVACAIPADAPMPELSGVLVATDADLRLKAVTFSSQKWPHLRGRPVHTLRASFGRLGVPVDPDDAALVDTAIADLATIFAAAGLPAPSVVDALVQRWPAGLPHYGPGHLARMRQTIDLLPAGLAVAGSGYAGVGVPACIGTAAAAVAEITETRAT